jgi:MFS transporter, DHA2 family, multidrug resistance protein
VRALIANSVATQEQIVRATETFLYTNSDSAHALMLVLRQISAQIHQQALIITYSECFWILGATLLASLPFVFIL